MQRSPSYLSRDRHGTWHFRARIPKDLQPHFDNKREIKRSTQTDSRREAVKIARAYRVELDQKMDELLRLLEARKKELRLVQKNEELQDSVEELREKNRHAQAETRRAREDADHHRQIAAKLATVPAPAHHEPPPGPLFSEVRAAYERAKQGKVKPKVLRNTMDDTALFIELTGDLPITKIRAKHIREFQEKCQRLPVRGRAGNPKYRGKAARELIETDIPECDRLKNSNINTFVTTIRTVFNWAIKQDEFDIIKNPCNGADKLTEDEKDPADKCFTLDELKALFESDNYKNGFNKPYQYWCPLIALYTGARVGEVAQLYLSDIRRDEESEIYYFDLNDFAPDKSIKTGDRRIVPMHSKLIELGLLRYVEELKAEGKERLFFDLGPHRDGYGGNVVTHFGDYQKKCGVKIGGRNIHGLRYTFQNALRRMGVSFEMIGEIVGHARKVKMSRVYIGMTDVKQLYEAMKRLDYGLDHPSFYR
jgi:integrase